MALLSPFEERAEQILDKHRDEQKGRLPTLDRLRNEQPQALRLAMIEAGKALQKARADHDLALALMLDTGGNADGAPALRHAGRAYADAVTAFSEATVAWFAADRELPEPM